MAYNHKTELRKAIYVAAVPASATRTLLEAKRAWLFFLGYTQPTLIERQAAAKKAGVDAD